MSRLSAGSFEMSGPSPATNTSTLGVWLSFPKIPPSTSRKMSGKRSEKKSAVRSRT